MKAPDQFAAPDATITIAVRVDRQEKELLGQSQAMGTTGRIVGPMLGGLIMTHWTPGAPFMIAGAMMIIALLIFWMFRRLLVHNEDF